MPGFGVVGKMREVAAFVHAAIGFVVFCHSGCFRIEAKQAAQDAFIGLEVGRAVFHDDADIIGEHVGNLVLPAFQEGAPFAVNDDEGSVHARGVSAFGTGVPAEAFHVAPPDIEIGGGEVIWRRGVFADGDFVFVVADQPFGTIADEYRVGIRPANPVGFDGIEVHEHWLLARYTLP